MSTSSSNAIGKREAIVTGAAALGLLVIVRLAIMFAGPGLTDVLGGWGVDRDFGYAWNQLTIRHDEPVDWYVVGSSRLGMGVDIDAFADEMGVDRDRVEKLTFSAGTPWEVWQLMKLRPDEFPKARGVVVDVGAWQFNANAATRFGERFPRLASWDDRVKLADESDDRRANPVDLVWPYQSQRRTIMDWLSAVWHTVDPDAPTSTHDKEWDAHEARVNKQGIPTNATPDAAYERHFANFAWSPLVEDSLRELAAWCKERKVRLILVRPPTSASYHQQILENEASEIGYRRMLKLLDELAESTGAMLILDTTADAMQQGTGDEFFLDYGHLSRHGGKAYTRSLAQRIKENRPR